MYFNLLDLQINQVIDFNWLLDGMLLVDIVFDMVVECKLFVVVFGESQVCEIWWGVWESCMYILFGFVWYLDGKQAVFLSDMGDCYGFYIIDVLLFKDCLQFLIDLFYDVLFGLSVVGDVLFYVGNGVNLYE